MLKFDCNLFSISKLPRVLNCISHFSSKSCKFHDSGSEKMICNAKVCGGLDLFGNKRSYEGRHHPPKCFSQIFCSFIYFLLIKDDAIMLWYYILGHPNFIILQSCFHRCLLIKPKVIAFLSLSIQSMLEVQI